MVYSLENINDLEYLKPANRKFDLALTSGCFDLIHSEHVYLLNSIAQQLPKQTKLMVATHSDKQITKHKGKGRPIFSMQQRVQVLKALKSVDLTLIWDGWKDVVELVRYLKPEFLATAEINTRPQNQWKDSWQSIAAETKARLLTIPVKHPDISTTLYLQKANAHN